jgi:thioredoxin 1
LLQVSNVVGRIRSSVGHACHQISFRKKRIEFGDNKLAHGDYPDEAPLSFKDILKSSRQPRAEGAANTKLQQSDFDGDRLKTPGVLAIVFYATWCPYCRGFYPEFQRALDSKRASWAEVDISDFDNPLWETFGINIVPSIILFKDGQAVFRIDGVQGRGLSKRNIEETLQEIESAANH